MLLWLPRNYITEFKEQEIVLQVLGAYIHIFGISRDVNLDH